MALNIVAFSGGVGGAKLVDGLAYYLGADLTVVVNTADDFNHLGLRISPDLDTVMYTLAHLSDSSRGWGRADESWNCLNELRHLGGPTWFNLGDRDLALHLLRMDSLQRGESLSEFTIRLGHRLNVISRLLPMTDDVVATEIQTDTGWLPFQEYFVAQACIPAVRAIRFQGIEQARPAQGVLEALQAADGIILGPSNPWVSLDPILAVPGIRAAMAAKTVIAVSPIIGAKALKGPAAKMFTEMGREPSATAVARHYQDLLCGFIFDELDQSQRTAIEECNLVVRMTDTIMKSDRDRRRLAAESLEFIVALRESEA